MARGSKAVQAIFKDGWDNARRLYRHLAGGGALNAVQTDQILEPGEIALAECDLEYARYYGQDVSITMTENLPGFTLSPLQRLRDSLDRAAARRAFERARAETERLAAPKWRDFQVVRVILTSERIICGVGGKWLSFWASAVARFTVDLPNWSFQFELRSGGPPLMLSGPDAPAYALVIAYLGSGEEALRMDWFAPLARDDPMPTLP